MAALCVVVFCHGGMTTPHTGLTRRGGRLSLPQVGTVTNSRSSQRPGGSSLLEASSPTWWLDYAQYRNEDVANLYVANKLSWRLFKKFKKRLSAMDNVRRSVRENKGKPFHRSPRD